MGNLSSSNNGIFYVDDKMLNLTTNFCKKKEMMKMNLINFTWKSRKIINIWVNYVFSYNFFFLEFLLLVSKQKIDL